MTKHTVTIVFDMENDGTAENVAKAAERRINRYWASPRNIKVSVVTEVNLG